jgi:hypothetical protein
MLLAITCDCLYYFTEQLTDGSRHTHCMALVMPRDVVDGGIQDVHREPL